MVVVRSITRATVEICVWQASVWTGRVMRELCAHGDKAFVLMTNSSFNLPLSPVREARWNPRSHMQRSTWALHLMAKIDFLCHHVLNVSKVPMLDFLGNNVDYKIISQKGTAMQKKQHQLLTIQFNQTPVHCHSSLSSQLLRLKLNTSLRYSMRKAVRQQSRMSKYLCNNIKAQGRRRREPANSKRKFNHKININN